MIQLHIRVLVLLVALSYIPGGLSKSKNLGRLLTDSFSKTRCDLLCLDVDKDKKSECRTQCKTQEIKPGTCPVKAEHPKWAEACVEACNADSQCDGTQRCCKIGCSATCSEPSDLLQLPASSSSTDMHVWPDEGMTVKEAKEIWQVEKRGLSIALWETGVIMWLPAMPTIGEPIEKKRAVTLRWSDGVGDLARAVPGRTLYLLEQQHHLGPKYEEPRLGEWTLMLRTNKTKVSLRNVLKPGRWYRFRVAAVSAAGTRGFSQPSPPFTPRRGPRPPPQPKRLRVRPLNSDNGTITVRLEWKAPKSDMPVIRYKVYWSRRVKGLGSELDSVFVNHQSVSKDQTHYDISDLQPNSMYFLQVQTISQFGLGKLRSDKASIFYNTTSLNEQTVHLSKKVKKIRGLKLHKVILQNSGIRARISWKPDSTVDKSRRYFVRWQTLNCDKKPPKVKKDLSATTEQTSFELYELDYSCSYKVNVNRSNSKAKSPDSEITINVPDCPFFQKKANGTNLHC